MIRARKKSRQRISRTSHKLLIKLNDKKVNPHKKETNYQKLVVNLHFVEYSLFKSQKTIL